MKAFSSLSPIKFFRTFRSSMRSAYKYPDVPFTMPLTLPLRKSFVALKDYFTMSAITVRSVLRPLRESIRKQTSVPNPTGSEVQKSALLEACYLFIFYFLFISSCELASSMFSFIAVSNNYPAIFSSVSFVSERSCFNKEMYL